MRGLITKDFLTIRKRYGLQRAIMDVLIVVALMAVLKGTGALYVSLLFVPIEVMSAIMTLSSCDVQWKWDRRVASLPVTRAQVVEGRYGFALLLTCAGFLVALAANAAAYLPFPAYAWGFYLFVSAASLALTLLFLSFVLPASYSLGENAGFAVMISLVVLLIVLGVWSNLTGNAVMQFVIDNFDACVVAFFASAAILWVLSCLLSMRLVEERR